MAIESCQGSYNAQCFADSGSAAPYCVLISASGSHRTTGYRAFLQKESSVDALLSFALCHERTTEPDFETLAAFQVTLAVESLTRVTEVRIRDKKGEHVVAVENLPTLLPTCSA